MKHFFCFLFLFFGFLQAQCPLFPVVRDRKVGFMNVQGRLILSYQFDTVFDYKIGFANVVKNGQWGYVTNGVFYRDEPQQQTVSLLNGNLLTASLFGSCKLFSPQQELIKEFAGCRYNAQQQHAYLETRTENNPKKWGLADLNGNNVIPNEYSYFRYLGYNLACNEDTIYKVNPFETLFMLKDDAACNTISAISPFLLSIGNVLLLNHKGESIPSFFLQSTEIDSMILFKGNDNKLGYLDQNGNIAIPAQFINARSFQGEYAAVSTGRLNKWGIINKKGKFVVLPRYQYINNLNGGYFTINKDGKEALMNPSLRIITAFKFDEIHPLGAGYFRAVNQQKFGYINNRGQTIIPIIYDTDLMILSQIHQHLGRGMYSAQQQEQERRYLE